MSDDSSADTPLAQSPSAQASVSPVVADKPRKASRSGVLFPLLTVVSLAVSGGAAYLYQQQSAQLESLRTTVANLQAERSASSSEIAAVQEAQQQLEVSLRETLQQSMNQSLNQSLQQALGTIDQQLAATNSRLQAQTTQLEAMSRELVSTNQRIRNTSGAEAQDWLLAEAESLLRLAQQYLLIAQDVRTAIGLFEAADARLRNSTNPAVFPVREVLARELASLQALPALDVQGIYLQLGAQREQIELLAVDSGSGNDFSLPTGEVAVTEGWLAGMKEALGQYFVVTKRDEAVTPLMTAEQEYLIRRGVDLQIEQARLALLQGQADIYRNALDGALRAIATQLREQDGRRAALIAALTGLRDLPISLAIPPIGSTLESLQQVQTTAAPSADEASQ